MTRLAVLTVLLAAELVAVLTEPTSKYCSVCPGHTMCITSGPSKACGNVSIPTISQEEKAAILDAHNALRRKVAIGHDRHDRVRQHKAANMMKLKYDDELAEIAQRWASQCRTEKDTCRNKLDGTTAGQNIHVHWTLEEPSSAINWTSVIHDWFNERRVLRRGAYSGHSGYSPGTNQFTQMAWADTTSVGCGYVEYQMKSWYNRLVVCNYSPAGNIDQSPVYVAGEPASQCPADTVPDETHPGLCRDSGNVTTT